MKSPHPQFSYCIHDFPAALKTAAKKRRKVPEHSDENKSLKIRIMVKGTNVEDGSKHLRNLK